MSIPHKPRDKRGHFRPLTAWEQARVDRHKRRQATLSATAEAEATALLANRNAARVALVAKACAS